MSEKLFFASDYMQGAHPAVLQKLLEYNLVPSAGYGTDAFRNQPAKRSVPPAAPPGPTFSFLSAVRRQMPWFSPPC